MTLCVTIASNLTDGLLINYTRIGSAFNKLSENIYFYIRIPRLYNLYIVFQGYGMSSFENIDLETS